MSMPGQQASQVTPDINVCTSGGEHGLCPVCVLNGRSRGSELAAAHDHAPILTFCVPSSPQI